MLPKGAIIIYCLLARDHNIINQLDVKYYLFSRERVLINKALRRQVGGFLRVSSTNKSDHQDITEILLKVTLNTIALIPNLNKQSNAKTIKQLEKVYNFFNLKYLSDNGTDFCSPWEKKLRGFLSFFWKKNGPLYCIYELQKYPSYKATLTKVQFSYRVRFQTHWFNNILYINCPQRRPPSLKATFSFQKGWPYKSRTTVLILRW